MMTRFIWLAPVPLLYCAVTSAHDGSINVSGAIKDNTCTVALSSLSLSVPLGDIASKAFTAKGMGSSPVSFTVDLQKCGAAASGVSFTFIGEGDMHDNSLLALDLLNRAKGIGIEIQNENHDRLPLNQPTPDYPINPTLVDNKYIFYARYIATTDRVTSGKATATTVFTLTWQ